MYKTPNYPSSSTGGDSSSGSMVDANNAPSTRSAINNQREIIGALDRDSEDNKPDGEEQPTTNQSLNDAQLDINQADDRMKRFYGMLIL